ncbi:MAG TPA: AMP-binding protein [Xanthobacteraceae bacterium]|jgi:fatty-acyl-CoA synthase|nr:AMP-binding protein [Xanthobacteraceae bacterium]
MTAPTSRTVPGLIDEQAARFGAREALVGGDKRLTYAQLREEVRAFAKGLYALGVRKGDHVAILMANRPEWIIADLAICALGAVMVAVNTWGTTRELCYVLAHSDAKLLIASDHFLKYDYFAMLAELEPLAAALPRLERIVHVGARGYKDSLPFAEVFARGRAVPDEEIAHAARAVDPRDVCYLLYTSGSTSTPKGVQLQHYALIENMWHIGERMRVTELDRLWLAVSLFWGLGCENALFNLLTHGGCVVLQEHFEAGEALRLIEAERCTVFYGTPNMAQAMAEHPERHARDLASLRSGGTVGTPEQIRRVADLGAREICNIYGLTETYGNCAVTDAAEPIEIRTTSVGRPLPGVDLRIVDEAGRPLATGEVGEIRVKGYVTVGYYKDADKNRAAIDADGYFITGDLGMLDEEGRLYFRGRIKEMIKTGGINVAPVEVEETLMAHPAVKLACVTGVPDARRDEVIAALIVCEAGKSVAEADLLAHCRRELAAYKVPRLVKFVNEADLPLTVTGKLQKNKLAEFFKT